jgi:uncharacterized protein
MSDDHRPGASPRFGADGETGTRPATFDCQSCGACCAFSAEWPRFSTESDEALDRLPAELVADDLSGMRCDGARCMALVGRVGEWTGCSVYEDRPDVCRACVPGGEDCAMARAAWGLGA